MNEIEWNEWVKLSDEIKKIQNKLLNKGGSLLDEGESEDDG